MLYFTPFRGEINKASVSVFNAFLIYLHCFTHCPTKQCEETQIPGPDSRQHQMTLSLEDVSERSRNAAPSCGPSLKSSCKPEP